MYKHVYNTAHHTLKPPPPPLLIPNGASVFRRRIQLLSLQCAQDNFGHESKIIPLLVLFKTLTLSTEISLVFNGHLRSVRRDHLLCIFFLFYACVLQWSKWMSSNSSHGLSLCSIDISLCLKVDTPHLSYHQQSSYQEVTQAFRAPECHDWFVLVDIFKLTRCLDVGTILVNNLSVPEL